jgi:hypothetical protein
MKTVILHPDIFRESYTKARWGPDAYVRKTTAGIENDFQSWPEVYVAAYPHPGFSKHFLNVVLKQSRNSKVDV